MRKQIKISKKVGQSPGTLMHVGIQKTQKNTVDLISFNENECVEKSETDFAKIIPLLKSDNVHWLNVDGLHNISLIETIGTHFNLHRLTLEDILNTQHRPGVEEYENYLFISLKMLNNIENGSTIYDQISVVLGKNFVLTFQEREGDTFNIIRERIRGSGTIRKRKSDFLFYRLADNAVDSYYIILDNIGERIEMLEEKLLSAAASKTINEIISIKKELIFLRKSVYPIREAINKIIREEPAIVEKRTLKYFSDVYDHTVHVSETMETFRDLTAGLMEIYLSRMNYRMNQVMKTLTIISTIFMPLTFIVGIYGMNFDFMPELHWKWAYPALMLSLLLLVAGMIFYMKRKKWW